MQNSIYKIKYLLFLSWDWEAWNKGRKCFHCLGAPSNLIRPCFILCFDGENISFDDSLVIYVNSTNIPPIMIINRIYETQNLL